MVDPNFHRDADGDWVATFPDGTIGKVVDDGTKGPSSGLTITELLDSVEKEKRRVADELGKPNLSQGEFFATDTGDEFMELMKRIRATDMEAHPDQEMFMGWPDRWFVKPKWRCDQGHIFTRMLRTEAGPNRDACITCRSRGLVGRCAITVPEDEEGRVW